MNPQYTMDQSAVYSIRVKGRLHNGWEGYFENMEISQEINDQGATITLLTGELADQAALQGTLQKLYTLGLALISVEEAKSQAQPAVRTVQTPFNRPERQPDVYKNPLVPLFRRPGPRRGDPRPGLQPDHPLDSYLRRAADELGQSYPGDELLPQPIISWTHGVTIHARPEQVWPWVAQIGDTRGGFYSYTFIENVFARLGKTHLYANANQIVEAWQNPQPGDGLISNALKIRAIQPGEWMLAESAAPDLGWTWLWSLRPEGQSDTRLTIRMKIQVPGAGESGCWAA